MKIAAFQPEDTKAIVGLFYDTVHAVNRDDYAPIAIDAWADEADRKERIQKWQKALEGNIAFTAKKDDQIVGFADVTKKGYLDRIYVHKDFQGEGIATALLQRLEEEAVKQALTYVHTDASITARPFFEAQGYRLISEQVVERKGVSMVNYRMMKNLDA